MENKDRVGRVRLENANLVKFLLESYNNNSKNKPYSRIINTYNNLPADEKKKINEAVIKSFVNTGNINIRMVLSIIKCHLEYLKQNNELEAIKQR